MGDVTVVAFGGLGLAGAWVVGPSGAVLGAIPLAFVRRRRAGRR